MAHEEVGEVLETTHSLDAGLVHIIANGVVTEMQDLSKIHMSRGPGAAGAVAPPPNPREALRYVLPAYRINEKQT